MHKKVNIAIVGFGNIGSYFYKILEKNKKTICFKTGKMPDVKYISAKNKTKKRKIKIPESKWIKNPMYGVGYLHSYCLGIMFSSVFGLVYALISNFIYPLSKSSPLANAPILPAIKL